MQFQVPQFIEVEDKILGPFTFKQGLYMIGSAGISYVLYQVLPLLVALPIIGIILALGASLAFFKYNDRPFILALEYGFYYLISRKLYLWDAQKRHANAKKKKEEAQVTDAPIEVPSLADSKLHELAWSLDIRERIDNNTRAVPEEALQQVAPKRQQQPAPAMQTAQAARVQ